MKRLLSILILLAILVGCEKNQPPNCLITSHQNGSEIILGEIATISVAATDPDGSIQKVRFYVDNTLIIAVYDFPFDLIWEVDNIDVGKHVIRAVAVDDENLEGEASIEIEIIEVFIDEENPVVEILTPIEDSTVSETINIVAKAMDNVGVEYVDFMIKEEGWVVFERDSTAAFLEYSASLNTNDYADGLTNLLIAAYDAAGNYGTDSVSVYINNSGDTAAPVVELFEPLNNDTISDYIVFRAKVTDNIGIEHVDFNILDGTWRLLGTDYYAIRDIEYSILWDTRNIPDGRYGIEAVGYDEAGNRGFDRIGITIDNSGSRPDDDSFIYEGRKYHFKTIGTQTWMVDNLAYLEKIGYTSIDPNPAVGYYVYGYSGSSTETARHLDNYEVYGILYNWNAAKASCPPGWHLPSDDEWKTLEKHLGMSTSDADAIGWRDSGEVGYKLKSTSGWINGGDGDNISGFKAIPGGFWGRDKYTDLGSQAVFWTSSQDASGNCIGRSLTSDKDGVARNYLHHEEGASVRCIKND